MEPHDGNKKNRRLAAEYLCYKNKNGGFENQNRRSSMHCKADVVTAGRRTLLWLLHVLCVHLTIYFYQKKPIPIYGLFRPRT